MVQRWCISNFTSNAIGLLLDFLCQPSISESEFITFNVVHNFNRFQKLPSIDGVVIALWGVWEPPGVHGVVIALWEILGGPWGPWGCDSFLGSRRAPEKLQTFILDFYRFPKDSLEFARNLIASLGILRHSEAYLQYSQAIQF